MSPNPGPCSDLLGSPALRRAGLCTHACVYVCVHVCVWARGGGDEGAWACENLDRGFITTSWKGVKGRGAGGAPASPGLRVDPLPLLPLVLSPHSSRCPPVRGASSQCPICQRQVHEKGVPALGPLTTPETKYNQIRTREPTGQRRAGKSPEQLPLCGPFDESQNLFPRRYLPDNLKA